MQSENIPVLVALHAAAENAISLCVPRECAEDAAAIAAAHYKAEMAVGSIVSINIRTYVVGGNRKVGFWGVFWMIFG